MFVLQRVFVVSLCQETITTAKGLRDCFALWEHPGWKKKKKIWAWKSINQESRCRTLPPLLQMVQEAFHHALFSLIENVFVIWSVSQSGVQHWRLHPATSPSLHFQCQISPGVIISGVFFTTGSCSQQLPHNRIENGKRFFFNKKKKIWSNLL